MMPMSCVAATTVEPSATRRRSPFSDHGLRVRACSTSKPSSRASERRMRQVTHLRAHPQASILQIRACPDARGSSGGRHPYYIELSSQGWIRLKSHPHEEGREYGRKQAIEATGAEA